MQLVCLSLLYLDIRRSDLVQGRSINLALSVRGRKALAEVGLEDKLMQHAIPMRGRMLHDLKGRTQFVPYDPNNNQVNICSVKRLLTLAIRFGNITNTLCSHLQCIYSVGRKYLNEILLNGEI